jgi:hypothetical protein
MEGRVQGSVANAGGYKAVLALLGPLQIRSQQTRTVVLTFAWAALFVFYGTGITPGAVKFTKTNTWGRNI